MDNDQKIRTSELRYRRLFEAAQDGILILDVQTGALRRGQSATSLTYISFGE